MFKFKFYEFFNPGKDCKEIKAVSSYEGKTVTASALLNPGDAYNYEVGKEIEWLRCDKKLCRKKISRFKRKRKNIDLDIQFYKDYVRTLEKRKEAYKATIVETENRLVEDDAKLTELLNTLK